MSGSAGRFASDLVWTERQLVQIARAVVARPRLCSSTSRPRDGPQEVLSVEEIIRKVRGPASPVVVSHDVKMLMNLSRRSRS